MPAPLQDTDFASFLLENTRISAPALCPEIRLHLADSLDRLWVAQERRLARAGLPPPFWGVAWPGGQALARHVLDHPERVRGLAVLDVGSGSGLAAIAAARAGALSVEAIDTDGFACEVVRANSRLNDVRVTALQENVIGGNPRWDVILAGDLWYERFLALRLTTWLREMVGPGRSVLLGDRGRAFFPKSGMTQLGRYVLDTSESLEPEASVEAGVWELRAPTEFA